MRQRRSGSGRAGLAPHLRARRGFLPPSPAPPRLAPIAIDPFQPQLDQRRMYGFRRPIGDAHAHSFLRFDQRAEKKRKRGMLGGSFHEPPEGRMVLEWGSLLPLWIQSAGGPAHSRTLARARAGVCGSGSQGASKKARAFLEPWGGFRGPGGAPVSSLKGPGILRWSGIYRQGRPYRDSQHAA